MEALYFHYLNGVVDETFLKAKMKPVKSIFKSPGATEWWSKKGVYMYDPRYVEYVENLLQPEEPHAFGRRGLARREPSTKREMSVAGPVGKRRYGQKREDNG